MRNPILISLSLTTSISACQANGNDFNTTTGLHSAAKIESTVSKAQKCDGDGCFVVDVQLKNSLDRAICMPLSYLPMNEQANEGTLEITSESGQPVYYAGPTPVILVNTARAEVNYVIAPGNHVSGRINLHNNFDLSSGKTYSLTYHAAASFCELYNRGNPSALFEVDPDFVEQQAIIIESKPFIFNAP